MTRSAIFTILFLMVFLVADIQTSLATEPSMADYTSYPIFMAESVKPNILIILDNSGSMNFCAYGDWPGDGGLVTTDPYSGPGYAGTIDVRVRQSSDDAEERVSDGHSYTWSNDLDLAYETATGYGDMLDGVRFQDVEIPQGATITSAYIEFNAYADSAAAVSGATLTFHGQDVDNAPTFSGISRDISGRTYTAASVNWEVPQWTRDKYYQSSDLSSIVQEIVNRSGWSSGNAMVFKISSSSGENARRQARSYESSTSRAPLLHIEYTPAKATSYYGYFDPSAQYTYSNNRFERDPNGKWNGNWLNWLAMRRIDIARKVLVGGLATSRLGGGSTTLIGDEHSAQPNRYYIKNFNNSQSAINQGIVVSPYTDQTKNYYYGIRNGYIYVDDDSDPFSPGYIDRFSIKVKKDEAEEPDDFLNGNIAGILQRVADKARWGLEFFNTSEGGKVYSSVGGNLINLITNIENKKADTWTPLAEAFYEGVRYFQQVSPYYYNGDYTVNSSNDPYYWQDLHDFVPCEKSFILLITDGESTQDLNIPSNIRDYDEDGNDPGSYSMGGSDYLDDVSLWAHTNDLRPDLEGTQNITLYTVFAFGSGSRLLKDAAKNGAFIDKDGDNRPSLADEWDRNGDGIPDTYFQAPNGYELESQILEAITDILKRAASGTAVSVLATSGEGEGNLVQAYFRPTVTSGTEEIKWIGYLQSLWIDDYGYMREDTNENHALDIGTDKVIRYFIDASGNTRIKRFSVSEADPYPDVENDSYETIEMNEIKPIWEAGKVLSQTNPDDRKIFTFVDKNNNQVVDAGNGTGETDDPFDSNDEVVSFNTTNASVIKPYLGLKDNTAWSYLGSTHSDRASNLINYIRGKGSGFSGTTNMRSRTIDGNVWKLGDIVHSTPVSVAKPVDNYGIIYSDESYQAYYNSYKDRETVVYVGANDGMLHAFTSWKYNPSTKAFEKPSGATESNIGTEIWAYIPQALLPQLKWLADPAYSHVYYVDLKPKIVDAKIFTADSVHPNGWGTVLIGGLNMGGKDISVTDDFDYNGTDSSRTFSPSYFAIDVTRPRDPRLLWERHYSGLGFSSSYPAVLKVKDKWFAVFGSGPTNYDGTSTEYGHIFVVDLKTGIPYKKTTDDWLFETNENNAFMSGLTTLDKDLNYNVDAIYIGEAYNQGSNWKGALYKVAIPWVDDAGNSTYGDTTNGHYNDDTNSWLLSPLFDSPAPIIAPAALSVDKLDNAWIYFGTGRYFNESDKSSTDQQYFFGIKDPFFNSSNSTKSYYHNYSSTCELDMTNLFDADPYTVNEGGAVYKGGSYYEDFGELVTEAQQKDGWFRSLSISGTSERVLAKPSILGGIVFAPTFVPNTDICGFGGDSYLYGFYYETGTAYLESVFGNGSGTTVLDKTELGPGLASSVGIHAGKEEGMKGFVQQSTGAIKDLELHPALNIKSGLRSWREK